ncbi:MAG: group II intron reverse transcriptase/maturase [Acidobacteria bacterium]|nr:group II intron reverse transcriptase/maturase [Acidobacteriota bacterium]
MSLRPPETVRKLQATWHAKAKEAPGYRFYSLHDKVYRADVLAHAYRVSRRNGGTAGVDGESFEEIELSGVEGWLGALAEDLRKKTYRPEAVLRVWIEKANGGRRALGIPTIRDRVVQTAAVLVLGPIFEADLPSEQYAYRAGHGAQEAVRRAHALVSRGHREVVDADLSEYFDNIPHAELLKSVSRRISDGRMLRLIKLWLRAPVVEIDGRGRRRALPGRKGRGCPQGAPISPLLANLYMRRVVLGWKILGHAQRFGAEIVNYADDLVICCRHGADEALVALRDLMVRLQLTLNESKTRVCRLPEESFDFLGYTIGRCYSPKTGRAYLGTRPSKRVVQRICRAISEQTTCRWTLVEAANRVARLNRLLVGWSNYFCLGPVSPAYAAVDRHVCRRLRQWLCRKHKVQGRGTSRYPDEYLYHELGLVRLSERTRSFPWAQA